MTQALTEILDRVEQLSGSERAELVDRVVERLGREIPADIERSHLDVVQRRIAEVESGAVHLIPGDEVFARARKTARGE